MSSKKKGGGGFQSFGMIKFVFLCLITCGNMSIGLSSAVYKGVMKKGYRLPTPIQRKVTIISLLCCSFTLFD